MFDRIRALDGAVELVTWISLLNVAVIVAVIVAVGIRKQRPPIEHAGSFAVAVALVYVRSAYRNLTDAPITYLGAAIHAGVTITAIGMLIAILRSKRT